MPTDRAEYVLGKRQKIYTSIVICVTAYLFLSLGIIFGYFLIPPLKEEVIGLLTICGLAVFWGMVETISLLYKAIDKFKS